MGWAMLIVGMLVALAASALLVMGVIESGVAVALGMLGIGLIAAAGRWLPAKADERPRAKHIERTIYSSDHQLRALVERREDGNYRIETQRFVHEYSPDIGSHDHWERQPDLIMTDTLASAVEIAARSVGAGTDDFFSEKT